MRSLPTLVLAAATAVVCCHVPADASARTGFPGASRAHNGPVHGWVSPQVKSAQKLLYVAGGSPPTVDIFTASGGQYTLAGQLTGFFDPQGIRTDDAGNLYVVDDFVPQEGPVGGQVDVFPKGATQPSRVINPYPWNPFDVAVDKAGDIYIANSNPIGKFSPGSVTVYGQSDVRPIRVLRGTDLKEIWGITLDARTSDVYVSYATDSSGTGHIARFTRGRGKPTDLGVSYGPPWGITQDGDGNLLACDGDGPIEIYPQGGGPLLGAIQVPGAPLFASFSSDHSLLYVSNFNNFDVEIFSYPGGTMVGSIQQPIWAKNAWPTGVAYFPPAH